MLDYLRIRDLALIEDMELEFSPGINVLTGETGAGKSFILKALGFLLGDRLKADMVRPGRKHALVEAQFTLPDQEFILRRELSAESGRSRLYVNDKLSSRDAILELRSRLVLYTSQHAQQRLLQHSWQAHLLDEFLQEPELLRTRNEILKELLECLTARDTLKKRFRELADRRDLLELWQKDIDAVQPCPGEEEELETRRARIRQTAHLATLYEQARTLLYGEEMPGIEDQLGALESLLREIAQQDETLHEDAEAISALRGNLSHIAQRLRHIPGREDDDLNAIEARLFALAQLKRKLRRSMEEIFGLREEIASSLSFLDACALDLRALEKQENQLRNTLQQQMDILTPLRRKAGERFCHLLEQELQGLGFSEKLRVLLEYETHELAPGINEERPHILWAPNPGQPPQPLQNIASGGELSRVLLALVSILPGEEHAVCIFDEVDAGVGGRTLLRVAERLRQLATQRQLIVITHWPQLAIHANRHFSIRKIVNGEETFTLCTRLEEKARMQELARMAGDEGLIFQL